MRSSVCCRSIGSIGTNFQESESCAPFLADRDRIGKQIASRMLRTSSEDSPGCSKRPSGKAAAREEAKRTLYCTLSL